MSIVLKEAVQQEVQTLAHVVNEAVEGMAAPDLAALQHVLTRAVAEVAEIRAHTGVGGAGAYEVQLAPQRLRTYFPVLQSPQRAVSVDELRVADARWNEAHARGHRYRDEARTQVGPLLTPRVVADRLGVSKATVNNWRRQDRLLGLHFDGHQYLYPLFQFVDSPAHGERGVLRHMDTILALLHDQPSWEKAQFFLTPAPFLGGKTPLELLRQRRMPLDDLERVRALAQRTGEMGW